MAKMGRPKSTPNVKCPDHPGTSVLAKGVRVTKAGSVRRRYICRPQGAKAHSFSVAEVRGADVVPVTAVPPACPSHRSSKVVRAGTYGKGNSKRQRYRCFPIEGDPHVFTPTLPRGHVRHGIDECSQCRGLTGVHNGPEAFARRWRWPVETVARGLDKLSAAETYAGVGAWALRTPAGKDRGGPRRSRSTWHIGADWTEAGSPVLFGHIDTRLRQAALAERERLDRLMSSGHPVDRPQVLVVDEKTVTGKVGKSSKRRTQHGFSVLVVAELEWESSRTRLRLARAMPNGTTASWALTLSELGYVPDVVVADGATAIELAVEKVFGKDTLLVPSLYHISAALNDNLKKDFRHLRDTASPTIRLIRPFTDHFSQLKAASPAVTSAKGWVAWWDQFEALCAANGVPPKVAKNLRAHHEPRLGAAHFDLFAAHPKVPVSTGAVEAIIRRAVEPMLARRRSNFRNIERTNRLFDLVVCREHGLFDDLALTTRLLTEDALAHEGRTTRLREVDDPASLDGRYASLRDHYNIEQVARNAGVLS